MDKIIRILEKEGNFRLFVSLSTDLVEKARENHNTSPVVTAALGRLLTATAIMGTMMKGEKDLITLNIKGNGPIRGILANSNSKGEVKGYPLNNYVDIPLKRKGKLDVAGAVGAGNLYVIKDLGLKEPFNGNVELVSGEIAEDLTYYFTVSEQTPSAVGLGVLVDVDNTVKVAGGFILQIMPSCSDEAITKLEKNIGSISSVTDILLVSGLDGLIEKLSSGFEIDIMDEIHQIFKCDCTKEKVEKALITIGKKELEKIANEDEKTEMTCHFCNKKYYFSSEEIKALSEQIR